MMQCVIRAVHSRACRKNMTLPFISDTPGLECLLQIPITGLEYRDSTSHISAILHHQLK